MLWKKNLKTVEENWLLRSRQSPIKKFSSMQKYTCRNRKVQFDKVTIRLYCSLLTSSNSWNRHRGCYPWHNNITVTINGIPGSSNVLEKITEGSSLTNYQPMNALFYSLFSCPSGAFRATLRWESTIAMQGHASEFPICEGRKYRIIHLGLSILLW